MAARERETNIRTTSWRYPFDSDVRAVVTVGLLGLCLAAVASLTRGHFPVPSVHDEFSYLLASDTFAHGRAANPPHPMWEFFETFHVLQHPTYASKYPPAQGLFLAVGQVLTGQPIVGVWLSYALMCAALTWMLLAWTTRRWALWGGAAAALFFMGFHADKGSWGSAYWGGAVAGLGAALLFGGARRAVMQPAVLPAVLLALGVGILANSRPFEGLLASVPVALSLLSWLVRGGLRPARERWLYVAGPATLTLAVVGAGMAAYNTKVTGSPWRLPYISYEKAYASNSPFVFGKSNVVTYRNSEMERYYLGQAVSDSPTEILRRTVTNVANYRQFYLPLFTVVLVFLVPAALRDRALWMPAAAVALVFAGLLGETWGYAHYAAPAVAPGLLLFVAAARRLRLLRIRRVRIGQGMLRVVVACLLLSAMAYPAIRLVGRSYYADKWYMRRAAMIDQLVREGGKHLILVAYGAEHDVNEEWVYNRADIDSAPVVWARSLGARDTSVVNHFKERRIWTVHVNQHAGQFDLIPWNAVGGNDD